MATVLTTSRSSRERYVLIPDGKGMGGYGKSRCHYLNRWVVANGVDRGNGYQGYMSVDYAISEESSLPEKAKSKIRKIIGI